MAEQQFKRNIAFKHRIGDLLNAKKIIENEKFICININDKKVVRVNIVANIIDKFENQSDKAKYIFVTLDDGSGQIRIKAFGDDTNKYADFNQGDTVLVIGNLRYFNDELYIAPEIIKKIDPRYLLVRKLELEKETSKKPDILGRDQIIAVKEKILNTIKNAEPEGGINMDDLIMALKDISPEIINQEVNKFIEEGIVFEPHPGKVRYLG